MLKGNHWCIIDHYHGDWRIDEKEYVLHLETIKPFLTEESKKLIKFSDIGYKGKNLNPPLTKERYDACDINFPGILTEGQNPYGCRYRMIDGKHRIFKMTNMGMTESLFYVIDYDLFIKQLQPNTHL